MPESEETTGIDALVAVLDEYQDDAPKAPESAGPQPRPGIHDEEPEEGGDDDEEPEPAAAEGNDEDPEPVPERWTLDRIESESDWTPEKLKSAGEHVRERADKLATHWGVSEKRREKVERRENAVQERERAFAGTMEFVTKALNDFRSGAGDAKLGAFARLANMRPEQVLEELIMSETAQKDPSSSKESARIAGLESQVSQLTELLRQQAQMSQQAQLSQQQQQQVQTGLQMAITMKDEWPLIAEGAAGDPQGAMSQIYEFMVENDLTVRQACNAIELHLSRNRRAEPPAEAAKPRRRQGGTVRGSRGEPGEPLKPMTEAQRIDALAALIPD